MNLLSAEDEALLADALSAELRGAGFKVGHAPKGPVAGCLLQHQGFDLAVLGLGLAMLGGPTPTSRNRSTSPSSRPGCPLRPERVCSRTALDRQHAARDCPNQ